MAPLLIKYNFIFEYNGLKFELPEDYDEKLKLKQSIKIKLVSLP